MQYRRGGALDAYRRSVLCPGPERGRGVDAHEAVDLVAVKEVPRKTHGYDLIDCSRVTNPLPLLGERTRAAPGGMAANAFINFKVELNKGKLT